MRKHPQAGNSKGKGVFRLITILAFVPYLVAFAPPDTSGSFISFFGEQGTGSYSYSSCGSTNHTRETFYDAGIAADHRMELKKENDTEQSWIKPQYLSYGVYGSVGNGQQHEFSTVDSTGELISDRHSVWSLGSLGTHLALDWKYFGLDLGGLYVNASGQSNGQVLLPSLGMRVGGKVYYSVTVLDHPQSLTNLLAMGVGYDDRQYQAWYGVSEGIGTTYLTIRFARKFKLGALGVALNGSPWGDERFDYGIALYGESRIPFFE